MDSSGGIFTLYLHMNLARFRRVDINAIVTVLFSGPVPECQSEEDLATGASLCLIAVWKMNLHGCV